MSFMFQVRLMFNGNQTQGKLLLIQNTWKQGSSSTCLTFSIKFTGWKAQSHFLKGKKELEQQMTGQMKEE